VKSRESSTSVEDTTWAGVSPEVGAYTIKFLKGGLLQYITDVVQNGITQPKAVKGTWKQSGNNVQMVIGEAYSVLQGTIDGNFIKGEGTNREGVSWKWTLFKKE